MTTTLASPAVRPYREVLPGGRLRLNMHWGQLAAWNSTAREVLLLSGTQSGKTCFAVDWLHREITRCGEGDYLMATASFPLLQLKLLPEFLEVFGRLLHLGVWRESDKTFLFTDSKTRVIFGTATNPESLESATFKAAVADEAGQRQFRRESREAILRRLAIHQGRILYPTTPYGMSGWLKTELFDRAKEPGSGIEVISFPSTANPAFPVAEFERARGVLPPWKFRMFYEGKFERPAGLVYDSFDEAACKIKRFPLPKDWPRYVGHDFGTANPAALFYAVEPGTGNIFAYDEYLPGAGRSTAQNVEEFKRRTEGMSVIKRVGGSHQEEEIREAYRAHGWPILEPKLNRVEAQVDRVYGLHKLNKVFVFDDLGNYLDELLSFSYVLDDQYNPTDKFDDEASQHLLAAARYILSDFTPETVRMQRRAQGVEVPLGFVRR